MALQVGVFFSPIWRQDHGRLVAGQGQIGNVGPISAFTYLYIICINLLCIFFKILIFCAKGIPPWLSLQYQLSLPKGPHFPKEDLGYQNRNPMPIAPLLSHLCFGLPGGTMNRTRELLQSHNWITAFLQGSSLMLTYLKSPCIVIWLGSIWVRWKLIETANTHTKVLWIAFCVKT